MIGKPIVSRFPMLSGHFRRRKAQPPDLHTAWLRRSELPTFIQHSPWAMDALNLLGPLAWDRLPERALERNWGQPTVPYAAFIAAYLVKLDRGLKSLGALRVSLAEQLELAWLLGFPGVGSTPEGSILAETCRLPTARHLTRTLRQLPNATLQFLLADSVRLIRDELAAVGIQTGECVSLDTKHVIAWVRAPCHGKLHCLEETAGSSLNPQGYHR